MTKLPIRLVEGLYDLGRWKPELSTLRPQRFNSSIVVTHFGKIQGIGAMTHFELRGPEFINSVDTLRWHTDYNHDYGIYVVVWASSIPTELKPAAYKLKPWRIYAFSNGFYQHRSPMAANNSGRWFARAYLKTPTTWDHYDR